VFEIAVSAAKTSASSIGPSSAAVAASALCHAQV
jgi:hypothetical protein